MKKDMLRTIGGYAIGFMIGLVLVIELIQAEAPVLMKSIEVGTVDSTNFYYENVTLDDSYIITSSNSYIIVPFKEKFNRVIVYLDSPGANNESAYIRLWYDGHEQGWNIDRSLSRKLNSNEIIFDIEDSCSGNIKLSLIGECGTKFKINKIQFEQRGLYISYLKVGLLLLILTLTVGTAIFIYSRNNLHIETRGTVFFTIILIGEVVFFLNALLTQNYYYNTYFLADRNDSFMDYFNMLALLSNADPYYKNANYPAMPFLILKMMYLLIPSNVGTDIGKELRADSCVFMSFFVLYTCVIIAILNIIKRILGGGTKESILFL